jgi:hypothetical protein
MVKDENDIVRDWVLYHGTIFGFENLFIIDNFSRDGTYEILLELAKSHHIHVFRERNYKLKGIYMKQLIDRYCVPNDIAFPIDIDEFIAYYDKPKKEVIVDKHFLTHYIHNLPTNAVYKANYLCPILTTPNGSPRAPAELEHATYLDMGNFAKSFMNVSEYKGQIDHGNHIQCDNYLLTNIVLLHYHDRNLTQIYKKNVNNCIGLGHTLNLHKLKQTLQKNPMCEGNHHIKTQIKIQEGKYTLPYCENPNEHETISIQPFKHCILSLK